MALDPFEGDFDLQHVNDFALGDDCLGFDDCGCRVVRCDFLGHCDFDCFDHYAVCSHLDFAYRHFVVFADDCLAVYSVVLLALLLLPLVQP